MSNKISQKKVKLIYDPESGKIHDPTSTLHQAVELLIQQGFKVKVALAKPKEYAAKIARKAVQKGYRMVIAMGGDGTIEAVARELVGTRTQLGIIPTGTENNLAKALDIPLELKEAVQLIAGGKRRKIDVGQVKVKKGKKMFFLELTTSGILAALFPVGKELDRGDWGRLGDLMGKIAEYPMPKMRITLDGESHIEVTSLLVTISNAPAFGKTFLIAPNAAMDDGLLDVNLYTDISKPALAAFFAEVSGGKLANSKDIERYRAHKIRIDAEPAQDVMADGVMLGKNSAKIKVCKHALRIVAGEQPAGLAEKPNKDTRQMPEPAAPVPDHA